MIKIIILVLYVLLDRISGRKLYIVDIGHEASDVTLGEKLAVLACQGLMNRVDEGEESQEEIAIYTMKDNWDKLWLDTILDIEADWELVPFTVMEYLEQVCDKQGFQKIIYSKEAHHELIPEIITVAGVLSAVPLDTDSGLDQMSTWSDHEVVFDAFTEFSNFTELDATRYIFEHYSTMTTGK